jgi:hypothetical protein
VQSLRGIPGPCVGLILVSDLAATALACRDHERIGLRRQTILGKRDPLPLMPIDCEWRLIDRDFPR